jgi:hypothetical protein
MTTWLRAAAIGLAVLALVDPAWPLQRRVPVNVHLMSAPGVNAEEARAVRQQLTRELAGRVTFEDGADRAATVVIGDVLNDSVVDGTRPVSVVMPGSPDAPHVTVWASDPAPTLPGWATRIPAVVRARGMAGRTSTIALEHEGIEVARVEHRWTRNDELFEPVLTFVPPQPGVLGFSIAVRGSDGGPAAPARADVRMLVEARRLRILAFEPRASWPAVFVRRAIEDNPVFDVSTLTIASRNVRVRSGEPPPRLELRALDRFDAILVGAPEELTAADADMLERFVRLRGGAVIWLPDRVPSGPYRGLLPLRAFEEWLTDRPQRLAAPVGALAASEFALAGTRPPGVETLATLPRDSQGKARDAVIAWSHGAGRFVFSGALDAWRRRGESFSGFWRAQVAAAAAGAPRPLGVSVIPGIADAGHAIGVRVRVRPDLLQGSGPTLTTPEIAARVSDASGEERWIRVWPTSEPGVFVGAFDARGEGDYHVRATSSDGHAADAVLRVRAGTRAGVRSEMDAAAIAAATGGVSARADDLAPVVAHLESLARGTPGEAGDAGRPASTSGRALVRPTRSIWWGVAFAGLLCLEWGLRRRAGAA